MLGALRGVTLGGSSGRRCRPRRGRLADWGCPPDFSMCPQARSRVQARPLSGSASPHWYRGAGRLERPCTALGGPGDKARAPGSAHAQHGALPPPMVAAVAISPWWDDKLSFPSLHHVCFLHLLSGLGIDQWSASVRPPMMMGPRAWLTTWSLHLRGAAGRPSWPQLQAGVPQRFSRQDGVRASWRYTAPGFGGRSTAGNLVQETLLP